MCNSTELITHLEKGNLSSVVSRLKIEPNQKIKLSKEKWFELKRVIDTVSRIVEIELEIQSLEITLEGKKEVLGEKSHFVSGETLVSKDHFHWWLGRLMDDLIEKHPEIK